MREYKAIGLLLLIPAVYSVMAVCSFLLHYGPLAGLKQLPGAIFYSIIVIIPYALLFLAAYLAIDERSYLWIGIISVCITLLALLLYSGSFRSNDGEYVFVYLLTPVVQAPFVLIAFVVSLWRRRGLSGG